MPTSVRNCTHLNLDIWLGMIGPLYWDNNVKPGQKIKHKPGYVWFSVNAKVNSGPEDEITEGKAAVSNLQIIPNMASIGVIIQKYGSEHSKQFFNAGKVIVDEGLHLEPVHINNVYGGPNPNFEIHGGDPVMKEDGDNVRITGFQPLELRRV